MASFYGTMEEFDRFLMPRIRNRIQTLARPLKDSSGGACEHCGRKELADRIEGVVREYSPDGIKAKLGMKSNRTVINGLRAFGRFCTTRVYRDGGEARA